ncbi:hypothetical protein QML37_31145, partial [Klebsiella pneumoniae]|uniref:hypothetical protein n=1 Tax=Klebsiella pneumoniae TaxID=573 RepID=UPI003A81083E
MNDKEYLSLLPFLKFTTTNYVTWASTIKHHIGGKGLWGYVDGTESEPTLSLTKVEGEVERLLEGVERDRALKDYERRWREWKTNHHKVISWLINSVDFSI